MKRTILFFLVIIEIFFIKNISHTKEVSNNYKNNEYKDLISTFTTYYDSSNVSRENNLILSANKLNNHEIKSGEEFSYNKVVGKRTIENGYDEAKALEEKYQKILEEEYAKYHQHYIMQLY